MRNSCEKKELGFTLDQVKQVLMLNDIWIWIDFRVEVFQIMKVVQMDTQCQIMLMTDDPPMYEMAFGHIRFRFVHRFPMSREWWPIFPLTGILFSYLRQILMCYRVNNEIVRWMSFLTKDCVLKGNRVLSVLDSELNIQTWIS